MISHAEYCVCCGEVIPEGRMVCPVCESMIKGIYDEDQEIEEVLINEAFLEDDEDDFFTDDCLWDEDCSTCPYFDGCSVINGGGWE